MGHQGSVDSVVSKEEEVIGMTKKDRKDPMMAADPVRTSEETDFDGERPEKPEGMDFDGEMPEMPEGMDFDGERPEKPDDMNFDGEKPEHPGNSDADGDSAGDKPEGFPGGSVSAGLSERFTDAGSNDMSDSGQITSHGTSITELDADTWIWLGAAGVVLVVGVVFAAFYKRRR